MTATQRAASRYEGGSENLTLHFDRIASLLGSRAEWDEPCELLEAIAYEINEARTAETPSVSDESDRALEFWRRIAAGYGDDFSDFVCAEENCFRGLDDGEGYDGYCGEHADETEGVASA